MLASARAHPPALRVRLLPPHRLQHTTTSPLRRTPKQMGKKKNTTPPEEHLLLPPHPSRAASPSPPAPTVDTHTHLLSTFHAYQAAYKPGAHATLHDFVRALYAGPPHRVAAVVDVWCEAPPLRAQWKEIADSALDPEARAGLWGGVEYWFVMGARSEPSCDAF